MPMGRADAPRRQRAPGSLAVATEVHLLPERLVFGRLDDLAVFEPVDAQVAGEAQIGAGSGMA
jgi:hypothetical protein